MTTVLMIYGGETAPDAGGTRTGGVPLAPAGFTWPACSECDGNMQFLGQLALDDDTALLSVFMCQNDPGLCEEWDPDQGGNRAYVFRGDLTPATVPPQGETQLEEVSKINLHDVDQEDYNEARGAWGEGDGRSGRSVLGSLGGEPEWIQMDESPQCGQCADDAPPMTFVAHLEEGHNHKTAMNFGGGLGYAFRCPEHNTAKFLWQQ